MNPKPSFNKGSKELFKYAGLGTQILVSLGLAIFIGLKLDNWLKFSTPLWQWILPVIVIAAMIWKLIKDSSKADKTNAKK